MEARDRYQPNLAVRLATRNAKEEGDSAALARAIDNGSADIIEALLKYGSEVDHTFTVSVSNTVSTPQPNR